MFVGLLFFAPVPREPVVGNALFQTPWGTRAIVVIVVVIVVRPIIPKGVRGMLCYAYAYACVTHIHKPKKVGKIERKTKSVVGYTL